MNDYRFTFTEECRDHEAEGYSGDGVQKKKYEYNKRVTMLYGAATVGSDEEQYCHQYHSDKQEDKVLKEPGSPV